MKEIETFIKEISDFRLDVNAYQIDSGYESFVDNLIFSKVRAIRFYCKKLGYDDLVAEIDSLDFHAGQVIPAIELIRSVVQPEVVTRLAAQQKPKLSKMEVLELASKIAMQLQATMTTSEINIFLGRFGVEPDAVSIVPSKRVYVQQLLSNALDEVVVQIAAELGLAGLSAEQTGQLQDLLLRKNHPRVIDDFNRAVRSIDTDPDQAIASASSTLESICKAVLMHFGRPYPKDQSLAPLLSEVQPLLNLSPAEQADPEIKRIYGGLINAGIGIGVLRTKYSAAHGKGADQIKLANRHARLAVNSMATIGMFLLETYYDEFGDIKDRRL